MTSWRDLAHQVEKEQRRARRNERIARRKARDAELERIRLSAIPDIDVVILEFVCVASSARFPRRVRGRIIRDPATWQWWIPDGFTSYSINVASDQLYCIERGGEWRCTHDFGGEWGNWEDVYGKDRDGYFLLDEYRTPGEGDVNRLQRALLATMQDLGIPLP